jgi:hypothetical protein
MKRISVIHRKLDELREILSISRPESVAALRPGLPREKVVAGLAKLPFQISPDAVELYTWADGNFESLIEFLPGAYFYPFDVVLEQFHRVYQIQKELDSIFHQPYLDCFRFLPDLSDSGYAFGRLDSPSQGCIIDLCIHAEWRLAFRTIEKLLDTTIECHRRGVFAKDGISEFSAYYAIGRELNPDMETWIQDSAG